MAGKIDLKELCPYEEESNDGDHNLFEEVKVGSESNSIGQVEIDLDRLYPSEERLNFEHNPF